MPLYSIACQCGETDTVFRKLSEYDDLPYCHCGLRFERRITAPMIGGFFEPYVSPATGKVITSRNAQADDLKRSGSILFEPGLDRDIARNKQSSDEKAFAPVAAAVDETVRKLVNTGKLEA